MWCTAVLLFIFAAQTPAKNQASASTRMDELVHRATEAQRPRNPDLESTMLAKQGHLATPFDMKIAIKCDPRMHKGIQPLPCTQKNHHPISKTPRGHSINAVAGAEGAQGTSASSMLKPPSIFIDTDPSLVASLTGGRSAEQLIAITKEALAYNNGIGLKPDSLASDFKFEGPVVGPLDKTTFVAALGNVDFAAAFPDWKGQFYGFHVDPIDGNRVWYTARGEGTNKGPFPGPMEATGRRVVNPPQVCSMTINEQGLISRYTIGYVVDRSAGNTGGLGGLYGILYAIGRGLPFPEAQPWTPSLPYIILQKVGRLVNALNVPKFDVVDPNSGRK